VLFFVSVGMLFDPVVLLREPLAVLATWPSSSSASRSPPGSSSWPSAIRMSTALTISASLAQIGEFSFILAGLGVSLKLLPNRAAT
jgi:CPA2 family monovalent cation:H+ antiporter-2